LLANEAEDPHAIVPKLSLSLRMKVIGPNFAMVSSAYKHLIGLNCWYLVTSRLVRSHYGPRRPEQSGLPILLPDDVESEI